MDKLLRFSLLLLCSVESSIAALTESRQNDLLLGPVELSPKVIDLDVRPSIEKSIGRLPSIQGNRELGGFGDAIAGISKSISSTVQKLDIPSGSEIQNSINEIRNQISKERSVDEDFFNRRIDKANTVFEGFGPHLLTKADSISISEQSEMLIGAAVKTVNEVQSRMQKSIPALGSRIAESTKSFLTRNRGIFDRELKRFCPFSAPIRCDRNSKYRTMDGSCNNLDNPYWGKSSTPFERFTFPHYDDDIQKPRSLNVNGKPLPGAREVSLAVHKKSTTKHKSELSHYAMEFGQFVSHDIQFNALSKELEIKDTTESINSASYLDLHLLTKTDGKLIIKIYDNRNNFRFPTINFPFLDSNIPSIPAYGVYISQLARYSRACGEKCAFVTRAEILTSKQLNQGYCRYDTNLNCCERQRRGLKNRNCLPISLPKNDPFFGQPNIKRTCMNFVRSLASAAVDCQVGPRQQINQNTHFLDGSAIYGSDIDTMNSLRLKRDGLLQTFSHFGKTLLPQDLSQTASCRTSGTDKCFRAGDSRVNQQPGLISLQTVWHREHNRIAAKLKSVNPRWNDEKLFQEARKINIAQLQHVTYNEYLWEILGTENMKRFDLKPKSSGYFTKYNKHVKPMIRNAFSAAAYRFGHSMIDDKLAYNTAGTSPNILLDLRNVILRPDWIYRRDGGVGAVIRGLYETNSQKVDMRKSYEITRRLFEQSIGTGIDLAAVNIQRGRDHGIPPYNFWRELCGLQPADSIRSGIGGLVDHTNEAINALKSIYKSVDDIDLFTGGVSEEPMRNGRIGPTFACLIGIQFKALKYGDRFFYENNQNTVKFEPGQLNEIRNTLMANIICRNTDISKIHRNVFRKKYSSTPEFSCSSFKNNLDFTKWQECAPRDGGWSPWRVLGGPRGCSRRRTCTHPSPNKCGRPCRGRSFENLCVIPDLIRQVSPRPLPHTLPNFPPLDFRVPLQSASIFE